MHCREYAAQLRDSYSVITAAGGEVVAVGTGNRMYAGAFAEDMKVTFPMLVDDDGKAAAAASLKKMKPWDLLNPMLWKKSIAAFKDGFKQGKPGARPMQLGAVFVVGPGDRVRYEHLESDPSDHAPIAQVLAALR
jgi:peroxiredoxin